MREHMGLYRGKRLCNGKWMQGDLLQYPDGTCCICHTGSRLDRYKVDPDTVGECTGLRDKNGKLIFEGDIIRFHKYRGEPDWVGVVKVDTYMWIARGNHPEDGTPFETGICSIDKSKIEIIGNIHDNPELLKGGEG